MKRVRREIARFHEGNLRRPDARVMMQKIAFLGDRSVTGRQIGRENIAAA